MFDFQTDRCHSKSRTDMSSINPAFRKSYSNCASLYGECQWPTDVLLQSSFDLKLKGEKLGTNFPDR
jgi:hypothetical protein